MIKNGMRPVHPGEVLRKDYLVPFGTTRNALFNIYLLMRDPSSRPRRSRFERAVEAQKCNQRLPGTV